VIIAENRSARPNEFELQTPPASADNDAVVADCPFCVGQESQTPPAVYELPDAQGHWQVRVVPNKYPAVTVLPSPFGRGVGGEGVLSVPPTDRTAGGSPSARPQPPDGPHPGPLLATASLRPEGEGTEQATGVHEVIVESSRHVRRTGALSVPQLRGVLSTYIQRLAWWHNEGRFPYALVFKNQGPRAGASLAHLHSQLVALDQVPPLVEAELCRAKRYHRQHRDCPYCRMVADERSAGERIVLDEGGYVAFCPRASLQPYEVWLLPSTHEPWFERPTRPEAVDRLAGVLHVLVGRLEAVLGEPAYNFMLHTTPWHDEAEPYGHWRIEVLPRLATFAGLEMTTGIYLNQLSPEHAAPQLRTC
jgi:UDPglucose--hexose-1-phosphate uridylyltransferase